MGTVFQRSNGVEALETATGSWESAELAFSGSRWLVLKDRLVDLQTGRIESAGPAESALTRRELAVLELLRGRAGEPASRDELRLQIWNDGPLSSSRACDVAIARLRKKLERDPSMPQHLLTVVGDGYRWVGRSSPALPRESFEKLSNLAVAHLKAELPSLANQVYFCVGEELLSLAGYQPDSSKPDEATGLPRAVIEVVTGRGELKWGTSGETGELAIAIRHPNQTLVGALCLAGRTEELEEDSLTGAARFLAMMLGTWTAAAVSSS